jgi:hypothetical protein
MDAEMIALAIRLASSARIEAGGGEPLGHYAMHMAMACEAARWADERAALRAQAKAEPVAWQYRLEYGAVVADPRVSAHRLSYPFGVCGADYLRSNNDGVSYVRETPLYTAPPPDHAEALAEALTKIHKVTSEAAVAGPAWIARNIAQEALLAHDAALTRYKESRNG